MGLIEKVSVSEGCVGDWRVERFTVSAEAAKMERMWAMLGGGRGVPEGEYTRLMHRGSVVMSDTPDEMRDHYEPVRMARGHCLVNGLGLGMVANAMAARESVERVTVIEISPEVIELVSPSLHSKVSVICADALEWRAPRPGQTRGRGCWPHRFGVVWHDIWPEICLDQIPERQKLMRRYGRRSDWQGCWAADQISRARRVT